MPDGENKESSNGADLSGMFSKADADSKNNTWRAFKYYRETTIPKVVRWTMKLSGGLIKNEKQASYVLLGFVVVAIIISLFLFFAEEGVKPIDSVTTPDVLPQ